MTDKAELMFADAAVRSLERRSTLPAKFERMLARAGLNARVEGKTVAIKMHLGNDIGFTTIHPLFVRILVKALKDAGAKRVSVIDDKVFAKNPDVGVARGYTQEVLGCPVISCFGPKSDHYTTLPIGFHGLDEAQFSGEALDADFFLDLSHVKGHGACGFGGALKNIAMGLVTSTTRSKLHHLEGGLTIDSDKCRYCLKCLENCPNEAIKRDDKTKTISFFYHDCTYCQHCVMVCPEEAITMGERTFDDFAQGMAMTAATFLKQFRREDTYYINVLTNITVYCDCWGFSTPSLVPDIGILMGEDIAAIDTASLNMIKTEHLLPNGLPEGRQLRDLDGHLFEKIHGKDPYLMVRYLQDYYECTTEYEIREVR